MQHATLLIDIPDKNLEKIASDSPQGEKARLLAWRGFIHEQILAAAVRFNDEGQHSALLAKKNDPLLAMARESALDNLPLGTPLGRFRLWRWQRNQPRLNIIAAGEASLPLACKLAKRRPEGSSRLSGLFYLPVSKENSLISRLDAAICFSRTALDSLAENGAKTRFCLPGMDAFLRKGKREGRKGNFIFAMADSLAAGSGALSVVRAMAAIWQIEGLPPWEARLFGAGPRFSLVLEEAAKLGVLSRLAILNEQPLKDVTGLCDAWLAPGHSPLGAPPALWAGVAADLPVIAADTPQYKAWLPADSALWFTPQSPQELGARMIEIMKNGALAENLSRKSASWKDEISLKAMADRLLKIIAGNQE